MRASPSREAQIVLHRSPSRRSSRRLYLSLWLLGLLIGQGALQGFVLCFGVDGHIAVESASPGTGCSLFANVASQGAASLSPIEDIGPLYWHCGPCSDLSISSESSYLLVRSAEARAPQVESLLLAASLSPLSTHVRILPEDLLPQALPQDRSFLSSLRSVVLLI